MSEPAVALADAVDAKVLLSVLAQVRAGDFTARMPLEWTGVAGKVADGLNDVIMMSDGLLSEHEPQTVLVADDDPDLVALVARRLVRAGYRVITASDGEQALQMVEQFLPELAVLDVMMPKLTGIDVVARLRAHPATRNVRIILISAGFPDNVVSRDPPAGADDYIKKPFGVLDIPDRVHAVLAR